MPEPHPTVAARLGKLAPDQRAAATAPPGPVLCVAPAGSGQDDDAGRPGRLAGGRRRGSRVGLRRRVQQAGGRGADRAAGRGAGAARRGGRLRARPDVPRAWAGDPPRRRRPGRPAPRPGRAAPRPRSGGDGGRSRPAGPRVLAAQAGPPGHRGRRGPRPVAGTRGAGVRRVRARRSRESGGVDFDDLVVRALAPAGRRPVVARPVAGADRAAARGRGAGPRPDAARACAPPRGPRERHLPRRRRRPVDLRLAPRGRAPRAGAGVHAARGCAASTSRPTTAARARSWSGRSGSWSTTGSGSRSGSSPDRGPADGSCWPRTAADDAVRVRRAMATWPADGSTRAVLARTNRELLVAVVARAGARRSRSVRRTCALTIEDPRLDGLLERRVLPRRRSPARRARPAPGRAPRARRRRRWRSRPTSRRRPTSRPRCSAGRRRSRTSRRSAPRSRSGGRGSPSSAATTRAEPRDRARHQGPRVGPRPRARRRVPGPAIGERRDRAGAGAGGGAPPRVRRLDAGTPLADAAVRPGGAVGRSCARRSTPRELGISRGCRRVDSAA